MKKLNHRNIFLIDGIGALVSLLLLVIILVWFQVFIGMPVDTLHLLAGIALPFSIYSTVTHFTLPTNWKTFLTIIAFANLLYCILILSFVIYHFQVLTWIGVTYFISEMFIILILIYQEFKVIKASS